MPFNYGLRLNNRQRIANARDKPVEANKNQSVDGAEGLFLRSGSPQNVYLLPQRQNFRLKRCPRPKQIYDHRNNEPDMISHPATASPDSRSTASQIEFATGTIDEQAPAMPADPESPPPPEPDRLEAATDQAIAACGGNARNAVKALIVANEFLEEQVKQLQAAVSNGYARGKFEAVPPDRKDWYD
jgi:hypothetical protein